MLSSVAYGDTPFQRKGAINCRAAATTTLAATGCVKPKHPRGESPVKLKNLPL